MVEREEGTSGPKGYYPPLNQMLSDLSPVLSFETPVRATLRAPVFPAVSTDQGGMLVGVVATLMDVVGGGLALTTFYPDWAATTYLSVQSSGRALSGYIDARGQLRKTGRNRVLVRVDIRHTPDQQSDFSPVATAIIGFTRFSPQGHSGSFQIDLPYTGRSSSGFVQPFYEKVGLKILNEAEGLVEVEIADYVKNSFNALHGGVTALLADLAGQTAARHSTKKPYVTTDLAIHFLRLGEVGPFQARASLLRKTDETVLSLVEIIDTGAGDRLMSIATNLASSHQIGPSLVK